MIITNNFFKKVLLTFVLTSLILTTSFAQEGSCSVPNTSINSFATAADANTAASTANGTPNFQNLTTKEGNNTLVTFYYSVKSSASGTLGILMNVSNNCPGTPSSYNSTTKTCNYSDGSTVGSSQITSCGTTMRTSRDCKLFPVATACAGTGNIAYDTKVKNSTYSPTFNPEWTTLTPSTDYVLVITMNLSTLCSTTDVAISKYDPPGSTCTSTIGTVAVTNATANGSEWDVKAGATLNLTASGYTLPPSSDAPCAATYGYIIFNQAPTLPITNVSNLSSLPGYQTVTTGEICKDDNKAGSSSSLPGKNKLWYVPFTADCKVSGSPVVFDDNTDLCFKIGTSAIVVNYLPPVTCATCANAICPVVSSTGATPTLARSKSTTDITAAGTSNPISIDLKMDGTPVTVCVPITIPSNATLFGFKHALPDYKGCIDVKTDFVRSYTLLPATCSGTNIAPKLTNSTNVGSGFNPEWNVVTTTPAAGEINPGDYIFCFTIRTASGTSCTEVPKLVLGYYTNGSCVTPIAKETSSNIKACIGASINFDGSTSTSNAASMKSYSWDFGDGSAVVTGTTATVSHTYTKSGKYIPSLVVTNSDGCSSTNAITTSVSIASVPNFKGSTTGTTCLNTQVCIDGKANWAPVTTPITITPPPVTVIPVMNSVINIPITIKGYTAGQKITNASDVLSICSNMEHSAIDDIIITLISPSGQTLVLHNRGGGASVLGNPTMGGAAMEIDPNNNVGCSWPPSDAHGTGQGIGMDYCFNTSATQTLQQIGDANFDPNNNKLCYQVPAGNYKAIDPFTNLIGSDLNGTWNLRIEDVYKNDDGTVFSWNLNLNPSLIPASNTIQPVLASQKWTAVSGTDITSGATTAHLCITPTSLTNTSYKYEVTDDFGCKKDTTIAIIIKDKPNISSIVLAEVCKGGTTSAMTYTTTSTGTDIASTYTLDWDATANAAGFSDITTYTTFTTSPQTITIPTSAATTTYNGSLTVKNAAGCTSTSAISVKIKDCCSAAIGTFKVTVEGTVVTGNTFDLSKDQTLVLTSNNDFVLPPKSSADDAGIGYAVFTCDPSVIDLTDLTKYTSANCFKGFHYSKDFTDKNDGTSTNSGGVQLGVTTFWLVPITFDDICTTDPAKKTATCKTGNIDIGVDIDGDGCFKASTPIKINYIKIPCGTCITPNCPIGSVPNYKYRYPATATTCSTNSYTECPGQGGTICNTGVDFTGTETTYQTVVADAFGRLGAYIQGSDFTGTSGYSVTSRLFAQASCGVTPIPTTLFGAGNGTVTPTNDNVYNRSNLQGSWNPEWTGLTPNGTYILETTFNLGTETLKTYCMDFYGSTNCPAKIGTIAVTGIGVTPKGLNVYEVDPGATITITSTNSVMPTSSHEYSYAFFGCDPGTLTAAELLNLKDQPCYIASDNNTTTSDKNNAGESTSIVGENILWVVPFTRLPDTGTPPKVIVNDGTDCYAFGSPIKIIYLKPPCGTCVTPNCPIGSVPTYRDRYPSSATSCTANTYTTCPGQGGTTCNTGVNFTGTEISYQTVVADAKGKLGVYIQGSDFTGTSGYTVTSRLFAQGNCGVTAIPTTLFGSGNGTVTPTNNNVYGRSSGQGSWNPEWTSLTPNGTYILETTFNLGTETLKSYCMDYYGSPTCPEIKNPTPAFSFCSGATPTNSLEVESPYKVKYFYSTTKLTDISGVLNSGVNLYTIASATNTLGTSSTSGTKEQLILTSTSFPANTSSTSIDYYVYAIFNDLTTLDVSCRDFKEIKVTVNTLPVLTINNPTTVCVPLTIDITNPLVTLGSTGNGILSYYTDIATTNVLANPSKVDIANVYYIKSSNGSCTDTKPVTVTFSTSPTLVVTNPAEVCQPATVDITNPKLLSGNSTGAIINYCSNSTGTTLLTSPNSIRNSGTYYVKSTEFGCSTVVPIVVKVNPKPKANFVPTPPNVTTINSKSVMLNTSLNAIDYSWIFSDGLVSSDVSPEHEFPNKEQSKQIVILIATSDAGCKDTINKIINVNEEVIYYIPNSFTPDDDDYNQVFKPVFTSGFDPFTYHLSIFNRWGELVFESNDTEVGWAGLYGKDGVLVQEGSYTWKIEFKLKENDSHKVIVGNVNILK